MQKFTKVFDRRICLTLCFISGACTAATSFSERETDSKPVSERPVSGNRATLTKKILSGQLRAATPKEIQAWRQEQSIQPAYKYALVSKDNPSDLYPLSGSARDTLLKANSAGDRIKYSALNPTKFQKFAKSKYVYATLELNEYAPKPLAGKLVNRVHFKLERQPLNDLGLWRSDYDKNRNSNDHQSSWALPPSEISNFDTISTVLDTASPKNVTVIYNLESYTLSDIMHEAKITDNKLTPQRLIDAISQTKGQQVDPEKLFIHIAGSNGTSITLKHNYDFVPD